MPELVLTCMGGVLLVTKVGAVANPVGVAAILGVSSVAMVGITGYFIYDVGRDMIRQRNDGRSWKTF